MSLGNLRAIRCFMSVCMSFFISICLAALVGGLGCNGTFDADEYVTVKADEYLTLDLGGGVMMRLVRIPAGTFMMGSASGEAGRFSNEGPQHRVTITQPFYMGVHEVTQEQYRSVMGRNPSKFQGADKPVERVSWNDAMKFCERLSAKTGKKFHLPTEAQWEYACRAGATTRFSFGDEDAELHKYGNYCDKSNTDGIEWQDKDNDDGYDKTAPVGSFRPNAWGLYDMHGNVLEWCADWYGPYLGDSVSDPAGPPSGSQKVYRGGCWFLDARRCRSADHSGLEPGRRIGNLGFRIVWTGQ
ncbi:MAG: formylglycine-generating enzyme family protein [Planctomycetes bacterium]|nr:formylglycine-generating enzyme family protein [Planctomycetota bacterium]